MKRFAILFAAALVGCGGYYASLQQCIDTARASDAGSFDARYAEYTACANALDADGGK